MQDSKTKLWDSTAIIIEIRHTNRSYIIEFENNRRSIRNRIYLKAFIEQKIGLFECHDLADQTKNDPSIDNSSLARDLLLPRRSARIADLNKAPNVLQSCLPRRSARIAKYTAA